MHEFTLNKSTDEMDTEELRSTLDEFMDRHEENVADYAAIEGELDEFSEKVDGLETEVAEYSETTDALQTRFAEVVSKESELFDADEVADRFSLDELMTKADALGAFSLDLEATEDGEGGSIEEAEQTFDDKPETAPAVSGGDRSEFRDRAESDLRNVIGDF